MSTPTFELVHRADRLKDIFTAVSTKTGNAGRCYCGVFGDSTQFISSTRNDGRGVESNDWPGGHWEGITLALKSRGFTMYGSQLFNIGQGSFASANSLGTMSGAHTLVSMTLATGAVTAISIANPTIVTSAAHRLADGDIVVFTGTNSTPVLAGPYYAKRLSANTFSLYTNAALTAGVNVTGAGTAGTWTFNQIPNSTVHAASFPFSNLGTVGPLFYVNAANTLIQDATDAASQIIGPSDIMFGSTGVAGTTWPNAFVPADPKANNVRCNYSYRALAACTILTRVRNGFVSDKVSKTVTPGAATGWVEDSLLVPADAGITFYDLFQFFGSPNGASVGPFVIGGVQWCVSTVDPSDTTTGPGGFAVGPVFAHGGFSMTKMNAELAYAGVAAMAEYMREARRSADYFIAFCCFGGNDAGSAINSFVTGDPSALDGTAYNSGTGPATNTGAGVVQNFSSFCAYQKAAWALAGGAPNKLRVGFGIYHTQASAPYAAGIPAGEQAVCDWIDTQAVNSDVAFVVRGSKALPAADLANNRMYNGMALPAVSNISVANPTVVTAAAHGLANGDLVAFSGTNSTPRLEGAYIVSGVTANTFTVPVNVTVQGTAGVGVKVNGDPAHLQSSGFQALSAACIDALLAATATAISTVSGIGRLVRTTRPN